MSWSNDYNCSSSICRHEEFDQLGILYVKVNINTVHRCCKLVLSDFFKVKLRNLKIALLDDSNIWIPVWIEVLIINLLVPWYFETLTICLRLRNCAHLRFCIRTLALARGKALFRTLFYDVDCRALPMIYVETFLWCNWHHLSQRD